MWAAEHGVCHAHASVVPALVCDLTHVVQIPEVEGPTSHPRTPTRAVESDCTAPGSAFRDAHHHASTGALERCYQGHAPSHRRCTDTLDFPDRSDDSESERDEDDNDVSSVHSLGCRSVRRDDAHDVWSGGWRTSDGGLQMRAHGINSLPAGVVLPRYSAECDSQDIACMAACFSVCAVNLLSTA